MFCWDYLCYAGCRFSAEDCLKQNKRIHGEPKLKDTPPILLLVWNRLGGRRTKNSRPLLADDISAKAKTLRERMAKEKADKKAPAGV